MTNSEKQQDALENQEEEKPSGRPIKGVKKERWNGMLPVDIIAYLDHLKPGKRSQKVAETLRAQPEIQEWISKHWKPRHQEKG